VTSVPWLRTRWTLLVGLTLLWGLVLAVTSLFAPLPSELVSASWLVLAVFQAIL